LRRKSPSTDPGQGSGPLFRGVVKKAVVQDLNDIKAAVEQE
jgi:hypothetical protein